MLQRNGGLHVCVMCVCVCMFALDWILHVLGGDSGKGVGGEHVIYSLQNHKRTYKRKWARARAHFRRVLAKYQSAVYARKTGIIC